MTDTTVLNRMINDEAKIPLVDHYRGKKKVVLVECGTANSKLEIHNLPGDAIVINLDDSLNERYRC